MFGVFIIIVGLIPADVVCRRTISIIGTVADIEFDLFAVTVSGCAVEVLLDLLLFLG